MKSEHTRCVIRGDNDDQDDDNDDIALNSYISHWYLQLHKTGPRLKMSSLRTQALFPSKKFKTSSLPEHSSKFLLRKEILLKRVDSLPFYLIRSMEICVSSVRFYSSVSHKKSHESILGACPRAYAFLYWTCAFVVSPYISIMYIYIYSCACLDLLITFKLTLSSYPNNSMNQNPSWEADSRFASQGSFYLL
jgi:hypothetical protein